MLKEIDITTKTIHHQFPTWEEFHQEALNEVERIITSQEDETNFGVYSYCVYDR